MKRKSRIDIWKVLEIDFFKKMQFFYVEKSVRSTLKKGFKDLHDRSGYFVETDTNKDFLFLKSLDRKSYDEFWQTVKNSCGYQFNDLNYRWLDGCFLGGSLHKKDASKTKSWLKSRSIFIRYLSYFFEIKQKCGGLKESLSIYFRLLTLLIEVEAIFKIPFKYLILFADMQRLDNLMAQMAKKKGRITVTLQHGLYVDYTGSENINVVNYKNVVSNYFLAWGEETKELIQKYHSGCEVIICGNPLLKEVKESNYSHDYITVILDQPAFKDNNQDLLNVAIGYARKHQQKLNIKLHPEDNLDNYSINYSELEIAREIEKSLFVLGHTSTMIFEVMSMGIPVFKHKSSVPANKINSNLVFDSIETLEKRIKEKINFRKESKYYITFVGAKSEERYRDFFEMLNKNNRNV